MGLEHAEFKNFIDVFKDLQSKISPFINQFLLNNAMECLAKTKKRTPVDTGELRRNWFITGVIRKSNTELIVYLYNTKNYSSFVENGHTTPDRSGWVEGYYMATVSIEEIERKIPQRWDREFTSFLNSLGV